MVLTVFTKIPLVLLFIAVCICFGEYDKRLSLRKTAAVSKKKTVFENFII